jgi:hypothetical protein
MWLVMEVVKRNANSKEIVAITVQENATGMMINTKNNASNPVHYLETLF